MAESFPLHWTDGWPRTPGADRKWSLPGTRAQDWNAVVKRLRMELDRLGASDIVLSTMRPLRRDGMPLAVQRRIDDPGAAVYFTLKKRPMVMAQDTYVTLADNVRSLAIAIEHLRGLERHGGGTMMERAFAGFVALPASKPWWMVLGISDPGMSGAARSEMLDAAESQYRKKAKAAHPDNGGSHEQMAKLNAAIAEARKELGNG